jgi:hypothetical protein
VIVDTPPRNKSLSVAKIELVRYRKGFQFLTAIHPPA